jgi:hypothetical protein
VDGGVVDVDHAGVDAFGECDTVFDVAGVHGAGQSEAGVVGDDAWGDLLSSGLERSCPFLTIDVTSTGVDTPTYSAPQ